MKTRTILLLITALAAAPAVHAQKGTLVFPAPPTNPIPKPPAVYVVDPPPPPLSTLAAPAAPTYNYEQRLYGPAAGGGRAPLMTAEHAEAIINNFKAAYPKIGSPRMLIYVNRELVDEQSGMKLDHREQHVESSRSSAADTNPVASVKSIETSAYRAEGKPQLTLADRQTVRDVERLFGRPLREAGATLVDQKIATQLIADKPIDGLIGSTDTPQARKDREALNRIADVVIEVLISSKNVTTADSQKVAVPDIQATAVSLKDSKIMGQAASSEILARAAAPGNQGSYDVEQVADATALALMEDMTPK